MYFLLLSIFIIIIITLRKLNKNYYVLNLSKRIKTEDGSPLRDKIFIRPGKTVFGNNFDFLAKNPAEIFELFRSNVVKSHGKSYIMYFILTPTYNITNATDAEELFQSTTTITKGIVYDLLRPFLGNGLLLSTDKKWHSRRKILTPAFHFKVLQHFHEVFKDESLSKLKHFEEEVIDLDEIVAEVTLNNICETALDVKLNEITGSKEYRKVIHDIEIAYIKRVYNPLMYNNHIFYMFGDFRNHINNIKIAHDFTSKIIQKRRQEHIARQRQNTGNSKEIKDSEIGIKQRYAMLDTLLAEEAKGDIDHAGICEEVNTFTFEGYDTTSTCLKFTILNLSLHPEVQNKCRKEIQSLGNFTALTVFDFNKLEYLDCVLKETLRLYPSVPLISRKTDMETRLNGFILPKGTNIYVHIYDIMRDPKHFEEPNNFKPERFMNDSANRKHPFAFVPFSAGSRNCIGQKFAILEMKSILVAILKNYEILPITKVDDLTYENGLILRTKEKIYVKIKKLEKGEDY